MTTFRWYLLGLAALFGAYVAVEYYRPKAVSWTPTLENDDKIPYGTYVLYDVLPALAGVERSAVRTVRVPVYSQIEGVDEDVAQEADTTTVTSADETPPPALADSAEWAATQKTRAAEAPAAPAPAPPADADDEDYAAGLAAGGYQPATYLFITHNFELTPLDCRSLLRHVARGNDVMVAASNFDSFFADTLGFRTQEHIAPVRWKKKPSASADDSAGLNLSRPNLGADSVRLRFVNPALARQAGSHHFALPALAATNRLVPTRALAAKATQVATDEQGRTVLLRVPHGRGHFYICSVPLAFSNYFVLQPQTSNFAFAALSYLPTGRTIWWDEYQKQGRRGEQSLLRVLLEHEALRTAVYLAMAAAVLFVLFEARRRQRIIPVLKPLPNTTLLFTRTVAGLYRQGGSHTLIAEKKVGLFLEYLRTRYHEPALDLTDEATRERLAQKSGVARADVDSLVRRINFLLTAPQVSDAELLALNKAINQFRHQAA
ncbi:hypothetical protein HNQ93_000128 [Hymenobacter luteus]|uniref:DUF4350 domain-containing protein n=2 Tax=Hymenobacter TaxID=89966 RepID=A0A7W9SXI4_9BACT|nr:MULTISPECIES: DUF4350 domain-containing protein [Hymenobacter]MBB4600392.1 hypothetical protein [Hymenobacter latericoloratus]MBB6057298.1 hypothetical protein [Hymenobacter luteus]